MDRSDCVLVTKAAGRQEVLAVSYFRPTMMSQIVDGSQPRKLNVVIPHLDEDSVPVPHIVTAGKGSISGTVSMSEYLTTLLLHRPVSSIVWLAKSQRMKKATTV